jgi:hypothetical protein
MLTMGDILEKVRKVLADTDHITRDQWDGICALYVTANPRKFGEYWKVLVTLRVFNHAVGQVYEIDHDKITSIIEINAPKPRAKAKEDPAEASS